MLADIGDILWATDFSHKGTVLVALYHLPGAMLVGLGAVCLRMLIEEVLKHISLTLALSRIWTILCAVLWLIVMKTTPISDALARKIHWNQVIQLPGTEAPAAAPAPAAAGPPAIRR